MTARSGVGPPLRRLYWGARSRGEVARGVRLLSPRRTRWRLGCGGGGDRTGRGVSACLRPVALARCLASAGPPVVVAALEYPLVLLVELGVRLVELVGEPLPESGRLPVSGSLALSGESGESISRLGDGTR